MILLIKRQKFFSFDIYYESTISLFNKNFFEFYFSFVLNSKKFLLNFEKRVIETSTSKYFVSFLGF
jgi:hypothetical protein